VVNPVDLRHLLGAGLALALLVGAAANLWYRDAHEPEALAPTHLREEDLELLEGAMRTVRRYYDVYLDINDLAAGGKIVLPRDPPLDEDHLRGFGWVEPTTSEYDPEIDAPTVEILLEHPNRGGTYWPRSTRDDIPYVVLPNRVPTEVPTLRMFTHQGMILIVDDELVTDLGILTDP
jgi:hypothetical protein